MKKKQRIISLVVIFVFGFFLTTVFLVCSNFENKVQAEILLMISGNDFDQEAALAKLREQIKGKEREPAETVFKNIQIFKGRPAGQLLAIMQMGFSRSLGINCTYPKTGQMKTKLKNRLRGICGR